MLSISCARAFAISLSGGQGRCTLWPTLMEGLLTPSTSSVRSEGLGW